MSNSRKKKKNSRYKFNTFASFFGYRIIKRNSFLSIYPCVDVTTSTDIGIAKDMFVVTSSFDSHIHSSGYQLCSSTLTIWHPV